ncbi:unnamed protein product [Ectocarpus sp. CCAP 1310/34]|nr:unnamed protein product [Ectocarpus sp. CCAP 1310/34]
MCDVSLCNVQVARTFKIGHDKVRRINNHWWDRRQLYETTAVGRGKTAKKDDRRRRLTKAQEDQLRDFINDEHKAGQVFRRTVVEWMHRTCNMEQPSNRSVGGLLSRLGFKRRRGRIKTPPLNAERLARIRRFLVEMDMAKRAEDAGLMVPPIHTSFGRGWSCAGWDWSHNGEGLAHDHGACNHEVGAAKLAKGDYHSAMTDSMFMEWLEHRLNPAEGGVSRAGVATATREYIHLNHPERLEGRVVTFMRKKGWALIWTPPYMPSFQPIELFWQHGKQYASLNFELKRKLPECQEGGWKAANCSTLVDHAIGEMNKWVKDRDGVLSGTIGSLIKPDGYDTDDVSPVGESPLDVEEGVGEQIQQESAEWGDGSDEVEP